MAVVVQEMVPSDVSGILFTADPTTGERSEMIINVRFDLGEAMVGGEITPDTYLVDRPTLTERDTTIGAKEHAIVPGGQGTETKEVSETDQKRSSLTTSSRRECTVKKTDAASCVPGIVIIVSHDADRRTLLVQFPKNTHHGVAAAGIEIAGRLVGEHDLWSTGNRPGYCNALLLASRELTRMVLAPILHIDPCERFRHQVSTSSGRRTAIGQW